MGRPAILRVDILADGKQAGRELDKTESRFSRFGRSAAKAGKVAALGLAAGLGAAAVGAVKLAKAAAEDEAAAKQLANTLKNTTGATDKQVAATENWITKQGKLLGVSDDELRPALGKLAASTHDLGKAHKLASLAMDVSAGTGKSLESVTTALQKAQNGSVGGLSKLGVATKDAAGKTLSLDQITGNLASTYKGAASTAANTAAGTWGRLKLQMSELGEGIGAKLLPIGNKLAGWALSMLPKVQKLGGQLARNLGPAFAAVGRFITTRVVPAARMFVTWFQDKIVPGIRKYLTPILAGARGAFASMSDAVDRNRPALQKILTAVRVFAEFVAKRVLPIVGKALGLAFRAAGLVIGSVVDVIAGLVNGISTAVGWVKSLVGWLGRISIPGGLSKLGSLVGLGAAGNLSLIGPQLSGGSPSYDRRPGWSTAALGAGTPLRSIATSSTSGRPVGATIVDARAYVQVDGALDADAVARQLQQLLDRRDRRIGTRR